MPAESPQDLDRTIPVPVRRHGSGAPDDDPVASPELLGLYLLLGASGMLVGAGFIAAEYPRQPWALPIALMYALVGLAGVALRWAPESRRRRWSVPALQGLVGLSIVTAALGTYLRGYGLAAPSLLVVPVLVFSIAALLGRPSGVVMAFLALLSFGLAQGLADLVSTPVPWASLAAGLVTALVVAVMAGGAMNARMREALTSATRREQRFRRLLGLAADIYWELDEDLRLVAAGQQDQDMPRLGAAARDRVRFDQLPSLVFEPEMRERFLAATAEGRPFRELPVSWRHGDGSLRPYRLSGEPRRDSTGRLKGYWGVARDVTVQQATQAALNDARVRLETLFVNAPLPLILHIEGVIADANPAAAALLGYASVESLRGQSLLSMYADESDRQMARDRLGQLLPLPPGTRLPLAELRLRVHERIVAVSATAVRVELKGGPAVLSMFVDMTERHQAEQALRRSETTLSHLVDTSPDLITLTDLATGEYHMVNAAFERVTGWKRAEALGRTALDLNVWGNPAARDRFVEQLRHAGVVSDMPVPIRRRDGEMVTLMISGAQLQLEGRNMLVLNGRDITAGERERLERSAILDNAGIGIAVMRERRFVLTNAEFERMIGWSGGSLVGQSGAVVWKNEEDYAELGKLVRPSLARGEKLEIERELRRRDGSAFLARLRVAAIDPQRPTDGGTVWIVEDVTERRQFEEALARARDDAEAANRAKSDFLANTSHELRTPLNGLLGLARLARDPGLGQPLRDQYLAQIEDSAKSLAAIISDILDLSKVEAGRLHIDNAPFDLVELLQSLARTYRTLADARGLQLLLEIDPALQGLVLGDALRVRQIVTNYIANAIKFTDRGHVRLSASRMPDADGSVLLECADSGPGIDPEVVGELFKPFTQADQSTTRRFGGTGLGLSICRELAALMQGEVGVRSEPGHGSCFWARLPLPGATGLAAASAPVPDTGSLAGLRVLMVEDNPVNMLIAVATLERWGVQVTQAQDGAAALAALDAATEPFHAVLMDVQMPGMSGHETTLALRQRPAGHELPVIALTAAALVSEREQALASGMDDFLTKPLDVDRLFATLQRWRRGRAQGAASEATGTGRPVR